jgi:hypothetical protein
MFAVFLKIEVLLDAAQRGLGNSSGRFGGSFIYVGNYQSTQGNVGNYQSTQGNVGNYQSTRGNVGEDLKLQHFRNIKSGYSILYVIV